MAKTSKNQNGRYYVSSCSRRIAIRRKIAPKNGVVIDGNIYMTLDEVNPRAGYGKDKGLADSTCHRSNHKRAIPSGWEIAPEPSQATTKKILALPWSTHCLVFSNGQSRGTSTYKRWNCLGKGFLSKSGNQYWARSCSRRSWERAKTDGELETCKSLSSMSTDMRAQMSSMSIDEPHG